MSTIKFKNKLALIAVSSALTAIPMTASATNGYFAHGYGAQSKGQAGAGVSRTQSGMSGATNPAALATAGNRVDFGIEYFVPDRTAETRHDGNTRYEGNEDSSFLIPEFAWNMDVSATTSFGVVVYGNGGMNTRYKAIPAYAGASGVAYTGVNLEQVFIAPTFAFKINPKHSLGVSLNLIYQTFEAYGIGGFCGFKSTGCTNAALAGQTASDRAGLSDQGKDSSTGYSVKVGWQGQLTDQFSMGFAYQSESDMSEFSKYDNLFAEQGDFNIPSNWTLGLAFQASKTINLMFDVQQINYTDVASISNKNNSSMGALGTDNGRGFGWDDMTVYKLGAEFDINSSLVLRAGYSKTDQPISSDQTSFNVLAPAVIEEHFTFGMTYTTASKSEVTAFVMYAPEVTVTGNNNLTGNPGAGSSGNGNLTMSQYSVGVGYGWNF